MLFLELEELNFKREFILIKQRSKTELQKQLKHSISELDKLSEACILNNVWFIKCLHKYLLEISVEKIPMGVLPMLSIESHRFSATQVENISQWGDFMNPLLTPLQFYRT